MMACSRRCEVCIAVLVLVAALGCKKHESDSTGTASGSAPIGSSSEKPHHEKPHHAGNCPSTVAHSTTSSAIDGTNVLVTITSDDQEAIAAIQKRTDELLMGRTAHHDGSDTQHLQNGEHGGGMGMCPVYIPAGATATSKQQQKGVVVSITSQDPAALKSEIDGRIQRVTDWVNANIPSGEKGTQGGLGGGKNDEGMNHSGKGDGKGMERKQAADGGSAAGGGGSGSSGSAAP
jgi:hypothetical protein